jgi:hypothetical protein
MKQLLLTVLQPKQEQHWKLVYHFPDQQISILILSSMKVYKCIDTMRDIG